MPTATSTREWNYERLNIAELIQGDRNEGYRQGGIGTWYDAMTPGNWPIPLNEITSNEQSVIRP